jgi:hypothetical protein
MLLGLEEKSHSVIIIPYWRIRQTYACLQLCLPFYDTPRERSLNPGLQQYWKILHNRTLVILYLSIAKRTRSELAKVDMVQLYICLFLQAS